MPAFSRKDLIAARVREPMLPLRFFRDRTFTGAQIAGGTLTVTLPPKSVVVLDLQ